MSAPSIRILVHERDSGFARRPYRIWALRDLWRARGLDVDVQVGLPVSPPAAIVWNHVDLTRMPSDYHEFLARCPRAVNAGVRDISKSAVSDALVRPGDGYTGPVIVKTDANCGGRRDLKHMGRGTLLSRWRAVGRFGRRAGLAAAQTLDPARYPIFDSVERVPAGVFENPALVVERFLPERQGSLYAVHNYYFCGGRSITYRRTAADPIVKGAGTVALEEVAVPASIVAERKRLGLDYGKLDFVKQDGNVHLLDANHTPSYGPYGGGRMIQEGISALLADGIEVWLGS